jgi:hypothetical protein
VSGSAHTDANSDPDKACAQNHQPAGEPPQYCQSALKIVRVTRGIIAIIPES